MKKRDRAWRRFQTERIIQNRKLLLRRYGWKTEVEPHRFHKQHPLDCGISNCLVCNKSPQELPEYFKYKPDWAYELVWNEESEALERYDKLMDELYDDELYYFGGTEYDLSRKERRAFYRAGQGVANAIERGLGKINFSSAFSHYKEVV